MTAEVSPVPGMFDNAMAAEYYSIPPEEYLDRNFGPGTWVRDPYDDVFIVAIASNGAGRSFLVVDRDLRRYPTEIPANMVN